jgi:hypothetical protein
LNGGFGQAYNLKSEELLSPAFGRTGDSSGESEIVRQLNGQDNFAVKDILAARTGKPMSKCTVVNFDSEGIDVAAAKALERIWFPSPASTPDNLFAILKALQKVL